MKSVCWVVYILLLVLGIMTFTGMLFQNIEYIGSLSKLKEATPPYQLALLSTALGVFLLHGSLVNKTPAPSQKRRFPFEPDILTTARLSLAAAFLYTTLYALLYLVKHVSATPNLGEQLAGLSANALIVLAPFFFAAAVSCLGYVIIFGVVWENSK